MKKIIRKKITAFVLLTSLLLVAGVIPSVSATTIHVYPGDNIQTKIDQANEGDTIFVHSGTYYQTVILNKNHLYFIGENKDTTIIDGSGCTVIRAQDFHGLEVRGFTIRDFGSNAGINLIGSTNTISGNIITGDSQSGACIALANAYGDTVSNNLIQNSCYGLYFFFTRHGTFKQNTIQNNNYGVYMVAPQDGGSIPYPPSSNNRIYQNNFIGNTYRARIESSLNSNFWDNGSIEGGNYWTGHTCYGDPSNGNYPLSLGFGNVDHYPFQHQSGWLNPNAQPSAVIDSISPNPSYAGQSVTFVGHGVDDETIVQWVWRAHHNNDNYVVYLGYTPTVTTSNLPSGSWTIYFKVCDNDGVWSSEAQAPLVVIGGGGKHLLVNVYEGP